jgi:hypothetical protein
LGIVLPKRQSGLALGVLTVGDLAAASDSALRQCWRFGGSRFDSAGEAAILIKVIQKSKIWNKMRDFVGCFPKTRFSSTENQNDLVKFEKNFLEQNSNFY